MTERKSQNNEGKCTHMINMVFNFAVGRISNDL